MHHCRAKHWKALHYLLLQIRQVRYVGVFNTLQWKRTGLVYIPAGRSAGYNSVADDNGKPVLSQRLSTGELVFLASDVPPFGAGKFKMKSGNAGEQGFNG